MRLSRSLTGVIAVALLAVGLTGCGSDGPSEASAEAYVVETFDNPLHYEEWSFLSPPWGEGTPPEVIRVTVVGDCAALQIQVEGRDFADTVFLRWDGEWVPKDLVTGTDPYGWLDESDEACWVRP